jgi:magnesium transporter
MAGTQDLSFAFLEAHPADAARVLERVTPQHVSALLAEAPLRLAAPVLRAMLPLHAARCLETLPDDTVSGLLRAMGPQAGVAVLHYVPESRRNTLLEQLPTALALAFRLLLGYPEDTVGAWMNPRVLVLPADTTAEAALRQLRDAEGDTSIFVIDMEQKLLGQADLGNVLRAPADTPLSKIMRKTRHTLPARTAIRAVEEHAGWNDHQLLPVVERDERFVGALERGVLIRALRRTRRSQPDHAYGDLLTDVASGYWLGVSSLIQLIVAQLPVTPSRSHGETHER